VNPCGLKCCDYPDFMTAKVKQLIKAVAALIKVSSICKLFYAP